MRARASEREMDAARVRADFDRIAELSAKLPERAGPYEHWLLPQLPQRLGAVLEVGCGTGHMARQLAQRSDRVLAIDLSPKMIEIARARSANIPNLTFELADVMAMNLSAAHFDCIVSMATLHHLPMREAIHRLRAALRGGGALGIIDLVRSDSIAERTRDAAACVGGLLLRSFSTTSRALRHAWDQHGRSDVYPTLAEVRDLCRELLPGAAIRRHFRWRYSLIWKNPIPR